MPTPKTGAPKDLSLKIQVPEDMVGGQLADWVVVDVFDKPFGREVHLQFSSGAFEVEGMMGAMPGRAAREIGRVVLQPEQAKRLGEVLSKNRQRYEARFGAIEAPPEPPPTRADDAGALVYSNLVMVNHRPNEFVLDFVFTPSTPPMARVGLRVVLPPRLVRALEAQILALIAAYEARFGAIFLNAGPADKIVH